MHTHEICPPLLTHPGWHLLTHTCTHTHRDRCHTLERWATIHSTRGAWGYSALLKGTSAMTRRWTAPLQLSVHQSYEWWKWGLIRQPSGHGTTHSHHWATAARTSVPAIISFSSMVFTVALPFPVLIRLFSAFGIQIGCVASLLICLCEAQNAPLTTLAAHRRQLTLKMNGSWPLMTAPSKRPRLSCY